MSSKGRRVVITTARIRGKTESNLAIRAGFDFVAMIRASGVKVDERIGQEPSVAISVLGSLGAPDGGRQ
jgi:hypothetical protein